MAQRDSISSGLWMWENWPPRDIAVHEWRWPFTLKIITGLLYSCTSEQYFLYGTVCFIVTRDSRCSWGIIISDHNCAHLQKIDDLACMSEATPWALRWERGYTWLPYSHLRLCIQDSNNTRLWYVQFRLPITQLTTAAQNLTSCAMTWSWCTSRSINISYPRFALSNKELGFF